MPQKLFAYGTLRHTHAPREIAKIISTLHPLGRGHLRGEIHDLGEYPAAIFPRTPASANGKVGIIEGEVYELPNDSILQLLDRYEGFNPANPAASLFLRGKKLVTLQDTTTTRQVLCWVYEYNRPLPKNARRLL